MNKRLLPLLVVAAFPLVTSKAQASAFALPEQGVSGLGNAYAGAAAAAEDASTVWWNPAGMSRLPSGRHFLIAGNVIAPSSKFSNNGSTLAAFSNPALTGDGGDAGSTALIPSLFFAMDLNPTWSLGLGVTVPFGLKTEYDANWIGRFQGVSSEVKTVNINPAVSYKLSSTSSVALGVSYQQGKIDLATGVNYSAAAFSQAGLAGLTAVGGAGVEGQNKTSIDGDAWGFNVGALFDVTPAARVGVHYRSSLDYNLKGNTSFSNVPAALAASPLVANGDVTADIKTPASAAASIAYRLNNQVELLGDITWTQWSKINQVPLVRSSGATLDTLRFNFEDSWRYSFGVNYKLSSPWTLKAGVAFDQTPIKSAEDRTVRLADNDRTWLSVGATYVMSPANRLDFGYTYVMIKDADINNDQSAAGKGIVKGTFQASSHILGVQYQHSF